jgi:hypothetical protein
MLQCECPCVCCDTQVFLLPGPSAPRWMTCPSCGRRLRVERLQPFGEQEWLSCTDPMLMVQWRGKQATPRKLRLFGCACCRFIWSWLPDPRSRMAVEVAERFADGLATSQELVAACCEARQLAERQVGFTADTTWISWSAVWVASEPRDLPRVVSSVVGRRFRTRLENQEGVWMAAFFRDVIGNPFRSAAFDPLWRQWNGGIAVRLAQEMYDSRDFARAPLLADMLEDAGCISAEMLNHLRGPGPHARGCWCVDALLARS